jgi:hypothetical protein
MVILDIKMPICCEKCPMFDDRWDYPTCYITNHSMGYKFNKYAERMPSCPLKELKELKKDNV